MTLEILLRQAALYLAAGVIAVPIATRLGLGSVLGYLLAGVTIGPWVLGFVAEESRDVMHFAELGVVMMLFLVGLELDPLRLWRLRGPVFGLGGLQMAGTALLVAPVAIAFGLPWQQALALGLILAMSSTAIALQSLAEKGLLKTHAGQTAFSILLFQDVAVIPILALFPLLATLPVAHGDDGHGASLVEGLPAWQHGLLVALAIAAVIGAGRVLVGPLLRAVARTGLREMFTAAALLIVLGVALLMSAVGLSAALGTFIAGVVLANSEFRHELTSDVEPFKGLLLGLFFTAVGASIDFRVLLDHPVAIGLLCLGVLTAKMVVLAVAARVGELPTEQGTLLALSLAQVGEFAFVLISFAGTNGILPQTLLATLVTVTAFTMAATPFLLTFHERVLGPRLARRGALEERAPDVIEEQNAVIIAGFGRFGQITGRVLRTHGIPVTILDVDSEQIDILAKFGAKAYYGDASRIELLHAAGAANAKVLVIAIDDPDKTAAMVHAVRRHFPNLAILARAFGRTEAYDLLQHGVEGVYRETFDTAVRVGTDAMRLLGTPAHAASRAGRLFRQTDEQVMRDLAGHRADTAFVDRVRERMRDVEQVLRADHEGALRHTDEGWDNDGLRAVVARPPTTAPEPPP